MLGSIFTELARNAWTMTPGNSCDLVNDANGNPTQITYSQGDNVVFIQNLTYDANNSVTHIECVKPSNN